MAGDQARCGAGDDRLRAGSWLLSGCWPGGSGPIRVRRRQGSRRDFPVRRVARSRRSANAARAGHCARGPFPIAIAISPQGNNAYAVDAGGVGAAVNEISQYSINPITGSLTPKSPATVTTGNGDAIAVTPTGTSVYVAGTDGVAQYSVNPITGDLTPNSPATVQAGRGPTAVAVTPDGKSAYVANSGPGKSDTTKPTAGQRASNGGRGGTVSQYSINPTTGDLTSKSPATVAMKGGPHDLAIAPDGKNAYVVSVLDNTVSQYRINPRTGTLGAKPVTTAATGRHPENIVMAPDGKSFYVDSENDGTVSQYRINRATGKIAANVTADRCDDKWLNRHGDHTRMRTLSSELSAHGQTPQTHRSPSTAGSAMAWVPTPAHADDFGDVSAERLA